MITMCRQPLSPTKSLCNAADNVGSSSSTAATAAWRSANALPPRRWVRVSGGVGFRRFGMEFSGGKRERAQRRDQVVRRGGLGQVCMETRFDRAGAVAFARMAGQRERLERRAAVARAFGIELADPAHHRVAVLLVVAEVDVADEQRRPVRAARVPQFVEQRLSGRERARVRTGKLQQRGERLARLVVIVDAAMRTPSSGFVGTVAPAPAACSDAGATAHIGSDRCNVTPWSSRSRTT